MKKILLFSVPLILLGACSGGNYQDSSKEDSIRKADSIRQAESQAAIEAALEAEKQSRLDSIRQDSIQKAEAEAFLKVLPTPAMAIGVGDWATTIGPKFKALGYTGSTTEKKDKEMSQMMDMDFFNTVGNYQIKVGDKTCVFKFEKCPHMEFGFIESSITINGDKEALDNLYTQISKYVGQKGWGNVSDEKPVIKKGNTISISIDYEDYD